MPKPHQVRTVINNRGGPRPSHAKASRAAKDATVAPATITVRVALATHQRGGRKVVLTPNGGTAWIPRSTRIDDTLVKALVRAHRWKRMMESGDYASLTELAAAEKVNQSYVCRILRLTLLAPKIVEAALDGQPCAAPQLQQLIKPFPLEWKQQVAMLAGAN